MIEQEYTTALDYLLTRLRDQRASEIAAEIFRQISRGKTITKDSADLKEKKIRQSEVGKTQTLPLTSKEALELAIEYLEKAILDVPGYAKKIETVFGGNVYWDVDQSKSVKVLVETEKFHLDALKVDSGEVEKAKTEIRKLKTYLNE